MVGLSQTSKRVSTGFYGLSQTCGGGYMGYKWSVTDVRVASAGYGWSVTNEKKRNNGVSLVYRCGTRLYLWEDKCRVAPYCVKKL